MHCMRHASSLSFNAAPPYLYAAADGCYGLIAVSQEAPPGVARQRHLPLPQPAIIRDGHHQQAVPTEDGCVAATAAAAGSTETTWAAWHTTCES
jgi:hypothetical protein